jgi:hypothetical protein
MSISRFAAVLLGSALFAAPIAAIAADRGPSTAEERAQILEQIHAWQSDPLGPNAKDQFGAVLKFFADVPDLTVHVCMVLDLPKGDKKDSNTIFGGAFMGQAAFVIEDPDKRTDLSAEYEAGMEGALRIYELLLQTKPKDRQPYLDDLVKRRNDGTLGDYMKARVASCKN